MPVFDFFHWTQEAGFTLKETGPLVPVSIGIPQALEEFSVQKGLDIPAPISGYALIDTGASARPVSQLLYSNGGEIFTDSKGLTAANIYPPSVKRV